MAPPLATLRKRVVARGGAPLFLAVVMAVGCGGKAAPRGAAEPGNADQRTRACRAYGVQIGPFLERFSDALDEYSAANRSGAPEARHSAARDMAAFVVHELEALREIRSLDAEIAMAHSELTAALELLAQGLEQESTARALDDSEVSSRAVARVGEAWERWTLAGRRLASLCPG